MIFIQSQFEASVIKQGLRKNLQYGLTTSLPRRKSNPDRLKCYEALNLHRLILTKIDWHKITEQACHLVKINAPAIPKIISNLKWW